MTPEPKDEARLSEKSVDIIENDLEHNHLTTNDLKWHLRSLITELRRTREKLKEAMEAFSDIDHPIRCECYCLHFLIAQTRAKQEKFKCQKALGL